jgi:rRNA-processing protein FCF1
MIVAELMRRKRPFNLAGALAATSSVVNDAMNLRGGAGPVGGFQAGYMQWVQSGELLLSPHFVGSDIERFFMTPRYWDARRFSGDQPQVVGSIRTEVTARLADLEDLLIKLKGLQERYGAISAPVLVPDTNVFVHYLYFEEAPWPELVHSDAVHVAIPLVVVEELDRLKYSCDSRVSDKARKVIRGLDRVLAAASGLAAPLPGRGTIEVVPEEPDHVRLPTPDSEIVQVCAELRELVPSGASVVTGDLNMKVRARTTQIPVVDLPDSWRRPLSPANSVPPDVSQLQ